MADDLGQGFNGNRRGGGGVRPIGPYMPNPPQNGSDGGLFGGGHWGQVGQGILNRFRSRGRGRGRRLRRRG